MTPSMFDRRRGEWLDIAHGCSAGAGTCAAASVLMIAAGDLAVAAALMLAAGYWVFRGCVYFARAGVEFPLSPRPNDQVTGLCGWTMAFALAGAFVVVAVAS